MAVKRVMEHAVPRVSKFESFKFQVARIQWFRRIVRCAACVEVCFFFRDDTPQSEEAKICSGNGVFADSY